MKHINMKLLRCPVWWRSPPFFLATFSPAQAQEDQPEVVVVTTPVKVDKGPEDALGRGNPRGSVIGFLTAASEFNWEKAAEYLDLRNLPPEVSELGGPELARQLNHVLSRAAWLDDYSVSENAEGVKGDDLPDYRDELLRIKTRRWRSSDLDAAGTAERWSKDLETLQPQRRPHSGPLRRIQLSSNHRKNT